MRRVMAMMLGCSAQVAICMVPVVHGAVYRVPPYPRIMLWRRHRGGICMHALYMTDLDAT